MTSAARPVKRRKQSPSPTPSASSAASSDASSAASSAASSDAESPAPQPSAMDILRAHFESQFEPIDIAPVNPPTKIDEGSDAEESWDGVDSSDSDSDSDSETERLKPAVVVEHTASEHQVRSLAEMSKAERKRFLKGKVDKIDLSAMKEETEPAAPDASEELNLKNDLALQRLLRESHLLDADTTTFEATGKNRLKAIESRIQALGGKPAKPQKMSMALRKGIEGKKASDEKKRRKEARENGIILEKEKKEEKVKKRKRGMGEVDGPAVGRFKGGMLTLSKRDIMSIEGPRERKGGKKGGKGKGGGGKRRK